MHLAFNLQKISKPFQSIVLFFLKPFHQITENFKVFLLRLKFEFVLLENRSESFFH